jgi:hypothetical protein
MHSPAFKMTLSRNNRIETVEEDRPSPRERLSRREVDLEEEAYMGTVGALAAEPGGGVRNRMKGQTV